MKNVVFIFKRNYEKLVQVKWAIKEYIDPGMHKILLIYLLTDKIFFLNDPRLLGGCLSLANKEEDARRKNAINYLGSIEKKLQEEFSADLSVKSFVVIGADCGALKVVLNDINPSIVILGPDSDEHSIVSFLQSNIGDFLSAKMGIPVLKISRIPEN